MLYPGKRPLHHPTSRQERSGTLWGQKLLRIELHPFFGPLPGPGLGHLFWHRLLRLAHHIDARAQHFLDPPLASPLVAGIDPQMREGRKASAHRLQKQPDTVGIWHFSAVNPRFERQTLGVNEQVALRMPSTFLAGSKPRSSPPTPVVLADWESTMAALGCGFLPNRARKISRNAALSRSQVPSMRQARNQ